MYERIFCLKMALKTFCKNRNTKKRISCRLFLSKLPYSRHKKPAHPLPVTILSFCLANKPKCRQIHQYEQL